MAPRNESVRTGGRAILDARIVRLWFIHGRVPMISWVGSWYFESFFYFESFKERHATRVAVHERLLADNACSWNASANPSLFGCKGACGPSFIFVDAVYVLEGLFP